MFSSTVVHCISLQTLNNRILVDDHFISKCPLSRTKESYRLTVSHFSMSRINPCSTLCVILSIRWSSSKTTLSIGIWKNGSELHPGWLDHDLTIVIAIAALAKNSHECDMLHLKHNKSGTVGYTLYLVSLILIIIHEVRFFNSYTGYRYLNVKVSKKTLYLSFLWILHQIQLLLEVAAFMPMAINKN